MEFVKPLFIWLFSLIPVLPVSAGAVETVRVGVLQFGTVNWEMDVVQRHRLDRKHGVELKVVPLSSKNAVSVALQGGAVDVIVSDWIWVNRQRADGRDYTYFPYSLAIGGLYVRPDAGVSNLADLADKKLGIAGGPVDKSWLLLQAYARIRGLDLAERVECSRTFVSNSLPGHLPRWSVRPAPAEHAAEDHERSGPRFRRPTGMGG